MFPSVGRTPAAGSGSPGLFRLAFVAWLLVPGLAIVQGAKAAGGDAPPNWAAKQLNQDWATQKLARSPRQHRWVSLQLGDRTLRAWVTYPQGTGKAPVVLVMHEVFGLTDSTLNTADEVAALGYVTVAPDMASGFAPDGGGTSSFPSSNMASGVLTSLPDAVINGEFDAWAKYALGMERSDGRLAIVGLSWGGGAAFRYAATPGHDSHLKLVCVFYDVGPPTVTQGPDRLASQHAPLSVEAIDVPIYGFYGSLDSRVMNSLASTRDAMETAHKPYEPTVYPGVDHAFMRVGEDPADKNPANAEAVTASLKRLQQLLGSM